MDLVELLPWRCASYMCVISHFTTVKYLPLGVHTLNTSPTLKYLSIQRIMTHAHAQLLTYQVLEAKLFHNGFMRSSVES